MHVHEPFAPSTSLGRAAPLARAQRRLLPRAHRAGALDPGRAPLRRAVLRPARRAHRVLRGDARADGALLPRPLRASCGPARPPPSGPSAPGRAAADRVLRAGGARRAAAVPARAAAAARRRRVGGDRVLADRRRADGRAAQPRARARDGRHRRRRPASARCSRPPTSPSPPRSAPRPRPGCSCARSAPARCPSSARLRAYEEVVDDGRPRAALRARRRRRARRRSSSGSPATPSCSPRLRARRGPRPRAALSWSGVADEAEAIYAELAARRRPDEGDPGLRERLRKRPLIDVDLHMHTDHSHDCVTPVEVLLATARERGPRRDRGDRPQRDLRRARPRARRPPSTASR